MSANMRAQRPADLQGRTAPWTHFQLALLATLVLAGLLLRAWHLGAEGFADDEIHKWLAANRYLHGDFGGDDVEHPMVMKALIALAIAVLPKSISPEALTRVPSVLAGTAAIWAVAQLGRRLYGNAAGLVAAGICALSAACVGYARIAKEDALFALFFALMFWCLAEARSAADLGEPDRQRRWEIAGAAMLGAMFASKYFVFVLPMLPIQYLVLRRGSTWRVPFSRWVKLSLIALGVMLALDWVLFMPSTWSYIGHYLSGDKIADRASSESYLFMGRLWDNLAFHVRGAAPFYFHLIFAAVKFAPPTALLMAAGLAIAAWRRAPADMLALAWIGFMLLTFVIAGAKYGRYFFCMMPAFVTLAGSAAVTLVQWLRAQQRTVAIAALATTAFATEALATVSHEPHPRLYVSALGGGDANVDWFFPHCDYFDAGVREAVAQIAARGEEGAEIATETGWVVRYYADQAHRTDLVDTSILPDTGCVHGRTCYVIVQSGRHYWHNQAALELLAARKPWTTVDVGGQHAVAVYRLDPGEPLFPPSATASK